MNTNLAKVAIHGFVALATLGLGCSGRRRISWSSSGHDAGNHPCPLRRGIRSDRVVAALWAWFVRRAMESRMPEPDARGHALVAAAIAFLLFLFLRFACSGRCIGSGRAPCSSGAGKRRLARINAIDRQQHEVGHRSIYLLLVLATLGACGTCLRFTGSCIDCPCSAWGRLPLRCARTMCGAGRVVALFIRRVATSLIAGPGARAHAFIATGTGVVLFVLLTAYDVWMSGVADRPAESIAQMDSDAVTTSIPTRIGSERGCRSSIRPSDRRMSGGCTT